jgi:hypothetical protein
MIHATRSSPTRSEASREDLEFLLVVSFAVGSVWKLGERAFTGAMGKKPTAESSAAFERRVVRLIDGYLRAGEGRPSGPLTP